MLSIQSYSIINNIKATYRCGDEKLPEGRRESNADGEKSSSDTAAQLRMHVHSGATAASERNACCTHK